MFGESCLCGYSVRLNARCGKFRPLSAWKATSCSAVTPSPDQNPLVCQTVFIYPDVIIHLGQLVTHSPLSLPWSWMCLQHFAWIGASNRCSSHDDRHRWMLLFVLFVCLTHHKALLKMLRMQLWLILVQWYLCQQVFRKHTDSSHSNGIVETY